MEDRERAVVDTVARITYKPGAKFTCWPQGHLIAIGLTTNVRDSRGEREGYIQLMSTQLVPQGACESTVLTAVKHLVLMHEEHEAMEWLKLDGELQFDPHKGY